jgi:hypothetical protein
MLEPPPAPRVITLVGPQPSLRYCPRSGTIGKDRMPDVADFEAEIRRMWQQAGGAPSIDVRSGDVHEKLGGYPGQQHHRIPTCCNVMRRLMGPGDTIVDQPPKGKGATLVIRYRLPR